MGKHADKIAIITCSRKGVLFIAGAFGGLLLLTLAYIELCSPKAVMSRLPLCLPLTNYLVAEKSSVRNLDAYYATVRSTAFFFLSTMTHISYPHRQRRIYSLFHHYLISSFEYIKII